MLIRKAEKKDLKQCENLVHIPEMELATGGFFDQFKADGAMIWMIAVSEKFRGNGIGSLLLENFEKRCKKNGIRWIVLYGSTKNPQVSTFYKKHKFCEGMKLIEFVKSIR